MSSETIYQATPTELAAQWRAKNREKCNESAKRYRAAHKETIKARKTDDIRSKDAARARNRRIADPDKAAAIDLAHRQRNQAAKMLQRAKRRSREKGVPFNIELADIIIPDVCPILGIPLVVALGSHNGNGGPSDNSPSLDRIIPALGYVKGNIQVISNRANRFKSDASIEELEAVIANMKLLRDSVIESHLAEN